MNSLLQTMFVVNSFTISLCIVTFEGMHNFLKSPPFGVKH